MPTVLIAEDDLYMADMLEENLVANSYQVCGIARTVDQAVALGDHHKPDLAILDIRLADGGLGTDIPARWKPRDRPGILYATAYIGQAALTKSHGEASLAKPFRPEDVIRALEIVEEIVGTGKASRPYPKGFAVLNGSIDSSSTSGALDAAREQVAHLRRQQEALATFGTYALGETDLAKVFAEAARICAGSLGIPFCKICRYRADENDLLVEAGVGWHQGVIGRVVSVADASSPQGRAFSTKEPVICTDLRSDTSFVLPSFYQEHGIISTVDVVIRATDGTPFGILEVDSPTPKAYNQHDIDFLTGFANIVAEAVSTSHRRSAMELSIGRMKDVISDRERLIKVKDELLSEKSVLATELQHRVRNNLQLIYSMLRRHITTNQPLDDGVSAIARRVMTLSKVYENLLGTGLNNRIDFGRYLDALCADTAASVDDSHSGVKLLCSPMSIHLDLDTTTSLGLAISELVANSYAHAFPDGHGSINVSAEVKNGECSVTVADDGVGFVEPVNDKSHGIGLVKRLMEQTGGSATFHSGPGTKWILTFRQGIINDLKP